MHIWIEVNTSVSSLDDDGINQGVDTVSYEEAVKLGGGAPMPLKLGLAKRNGVIARLSFAYISPPKMAANVIPFIRTVSMCTEHDGTEPNEKNQNKRVRMHGPATYSS
jgi:hypothetical protein